MFTFIIGGAGSGKSEYAERWVGSLPGKKIYLATMQPFDAECLARIEKHRSARAGRSFQTVECYCNLSALILPTGSNVLLECLGNLTANELFSPEGGGEQAVLEGVLSVWHQCSNLTVVTNEVFSGGRDYEGETDTYLRTLAEANRKLAEKADRVVEVVCGIPNILKGETE